MKTETGDYVKNTAPCAMCKRLIINSGIKTVVSRENKKNFKITEVDSWITNDDTF